MEKKLIDAKVLSFAAVAGILGVGLAVGIGASAFGGLMGEGKGVGMSIENKDAVHEALKNNDYETWSTLVTDQCTQSVTEEHFNEMREHFEEMEAHREAMNEVLKSGDYDAWVAFMEEEEGRRGKKLTEKITEENFSTFVEMHTAIQEGDVKKVEELRKKLGLPLPHQLQDGLHRGGVGKGAERGGNK